MVSIKPAQVISAEDILAVADSFRSDCREIGHELGGADFSPAKLIGDKVGRVLSVFKDPYLTHREFVAIVNRCCYDTTIMAEAQKYPAATMHTVWESITTCASSYSQYFNTAAHRER